jgi:hypothetical protein
MDRRILLRARNIGILERWNIGKRLEIKSLWFSFVPIIPSFHYSIIPIPEKRRER